MTKARTLANFISDNNEFADGTISVSEVSGAAPLASPSFTGTPKSDSSFEIEGSSNAILTLDETSGVAGGAQSTYISMQAAGSQTAYMGVASSGGIMYVTNEYGPLNLMTGTSGSEQSRLLMYASNEAVFNEGSLNYDFRVESDNTTHMLYVDAGLDSVGVGTGNLTTARSMFVAGKGIGIRNSLNGNNDNWSSIYNSEASSASNLIIQPGTGGGFTFTHGSGLHTFPATGYDTVFNQDGNDADFRVESDDQSNMFVIDAGENKVGFGRYPNSSGTGNTQIEGALQIHDGLGTVPLFINGGADYAGMKLKRADTNSAGGVDAWNWTIRPSYASGVASGGDISYLKVNSQYDVNQGGQLQHEVVINEDQYNLDFRVESDGNAHQLFIDASANKIGIGNSSLGGATITSLQRNNALHLGGSAAANTNSGYFISSRQKDVATDGWVTLGAWDNGTTRKMYYGGGNWGDQEATTHTFYAGAYDAGANGAQVRMEITSDGIVVNDGSYDADFRVESDNNSHAIFVNAGEDIVGIGTSSGPYYQKGHAFNARAHIANSAIIGSGYMTIIANPNGRVFTLDTAGNGAQAFLHLQGSQYNGYRDQYFWATNYSGSWTVYSNTNATSGTAPTYTIGSNSSQNPTITLSFSTGYSGGYLKVFGSTHWTVT